MQTHGEMEDGISESGDGMKIPTEQMYLLFSSHFLAAKRAH